MSLRDATLLPCLQPLPFTSCSLASAPHSHPANSPSHLLLNRDTGMGELRTWGATTLASWVIPICTEREPAHLLSVLEEVCRGRAPTPKLGAMRVCAVLDLATFKSMLVTQRTEVSASMAGMASWRPPQDRLPLRLEPALEGDSE